MSNLSFWWRFDLITKLCLYLTVSVYLSAQYKNTHITSSHLDISFIWSLDKHGTIYLVYFTAVKSKKTCIGGSTLLQNLVLCIQLWPQWSMATVNEGRGPLSPIRFIMMIHRYRQAKDALTLICTHRHTLLDLHTCTHRNKFACMHSWTHLCMCVHVHTYILTHKWGSFLTFPTAKSRYVHQCGLQKSHIKTLTESVPRKGPFWP